EGMVDFREEMTPEEIDELNSTVRPVRLVLIKVAVFVYPCLLLTNHSIPALQNRVPLHLGVRVMPCDITTRWNLTYDMLVFVLKYQQVIDEITVNRDM
ncbi:hypothetical protein CPC08DRAFT_609386, partial [Agrocybe pediades]